MMDRACRVAARGQVAVLDDILSEPVWNQEGVREFALQAVGEIALRGDGRAMDVILCDMKHVNAIA